MSKNMTLFIRNFKIRLYSLAMRVQKRQLYLLEQHSESFKLDEQL